MDSQLSAFLALANFQLAWEKVAANNGCAGVDGQSVAQFSRHESRNLARLRQSVSNGTYRALPLRQIFIPKKNKSWRSLRVPAVRDRIVQQALLNVLHPVFEPQFESCSFAYRPGRSHHMAVDQISAWQRRGYRWVLDADIVQYFDNVEHQRLLAEVAERLPRKIVSATFTELVLHLVEQWISVGVLTPEGLLLPQKGIPQGSVVSPILANVYLDDFDEAFLDRSLKLVRYADDFVILGRKQKEIINVRREVSDLLGEMGLQLHQEKTHLTDFKHGFRFLGHAFVGDLVVPVQKNKQRHKQSFLGKGGLRRSGVSAGYATHQKAQVPLPKGDLGGSYVPSIADLRIVHADPVSKSSPLQGALVDALKKSQQPIPPPLFVVLGYRVRQEKRVEIISQESIWREGMSTLYLVNQGTTVKKEHGRFLVKEPKETLFEIPSREVKRLLVFGNVQLTTAVITECLDLQIPVLFLSQLGQYKGHLWSAEYDDISVEMAQYQRQGDESFRLETARNIVIGKLANSQRLLWRLNRKRQNEVVQKAIEGLDNDMATAEQVTALDALRGCEGAGAARYFKALGQLITNEAFTFEQRNRRPPKDPVNSLLSFGYTLLFNNVLSLLLAEGLNPYLGHLHGSEKKKMFLAFDLVEEFRSPIVDSLVMRLINQKFFKPTDFTWPNKEGGIYLNDVARRPFLKHFEKRLSLELSHPDVQSPVSYRRIIQLQIQRYKQALLSDIPYVPYRKVY
ncbi:CRISPR-associated endonuclease Cas1 [[Limnothrix rosea] IAM M-220]|uniref:CRISPR-associated endonuclease Cas1 n=1 Tax=[Limnothrix rosea] IAM M-220 TaxID=454133 RepID=UPI00095DA80F|nr:CRISPR-associated endonuclease Cas1 [[Limnothrix rosea] IAM M-220]OKH18650.1 CRISPR-associated endonuclease Cas1 [[Limnothrix rosea] IAM M-220]